MDTRWTLQGLTPERLVQLTEGQATLSEARKILGAFVRHGALPGPQAGVRRVVMDLMRARLHAGELRLISRQASQHDPFEKLLFAASDEVNFETVRIPLEITGRFSVCVSSQVGCALGCTFCATGRMGLVRNLATWEIVEQVRQVRLTLPEGARVRGVVFQGMGEPMANLDRVLEAIEVLTEPSLYAIDTRAITVTTSGLPSGIRRLAKEAPRVRLGLSLSSLFPAVRKRLMPIEAKHPLEEVLAAAREHAVTTGLSPMFAYTLLAGENDSQEQIERLAMAVREFHAATGHRPTLRLIPYNRIGDDDPYDRQSAEQEAKVRELLREFGAPSKLRYSGGGDIGAACGQLATASSRASARAARA